MEIINTEILVSSLFAVGFDKVDAALFTYTLGKLSMDDKNNTFTFEDKETSEVFNKYIDYDGFVFKLKEGYLFNTNVSPSERHIIPLSKALHVNKKLIEYLNNLDFSEIVLKKAEEYGMDSLIENGEEVNTDLFSKKELDILKGIKQRKIHEEITQEIFRQLLINNGIADNFVLDYYDGFEFNGLDTKVIGNLVYIYKDNDTWYVFDGIDKEVFIGYSTGKSENIKEFTNQKEAYIEAAKRRGVNVSKEDLTYAENDIKSILKIIKTAKKYLKRIVDFFESHGVDQITERYQLLEEYEKELITNKTNRKTPKIKRKK